MIERLFFKNHLSFEACNVSFSKGLIVFTGPSGAGKSVFMQALLSLFGHAEVMAETIECIVDRPLNLEAFGFETEETTIFKCLKSKSVRYFINDHSTSKKGMADVSRTFLSYLSLKDASEFESNRLLSLLDGVCGVNEPLHVSHVEAFETTFLHYKSLKIALESVEEKEKKVEELKEFARFEITKIEEIAPKIGEDEELLSFKKALSKKEKLENALTKASAIFTVESSVHEALHLMEAQSEFFDEAMNALRLLFEKEHDKLEGLGEMDIEAMLDRIEKIAQLKKRYGSIDEALEHLSRRREELMRYETLSFEKQTLEKELKCQKERLDEQALILRKTRNLYLPLLEQTLNRYLQELYMPTLSLGMEEGDLHEKGADTLHVNLGKVDVKKISSGEYNRLRLAFLATHNAFLLSHGGVLILDEIDANLSGKESMSVANVLKTLSAQYQIFAISHQPQLSSCAHQHFFVSKDALHVSHVTALDHEARKVELARMISGENIGEEALSFAQSLLESNRS